MNNLAIQIDGRNEKRLKLKISKKNGNGRKGDLCPFADDHTFIIDAIRELKHVFLQDHAFIKESIREVQRAVERMADEGKK